MATDFTQIYGPFYGGMLGKAQLNQQGALAETQQLGILSQALRAMEQNELVRQQVEIAKLKAIKEGAQMDAVQKILNSISNRATGAPSAPADTTFRRPDPFTGQGGMSLPVAPQPAQFQFPVTSEEALALSLGGIGGAGNITQARRQAFEEFKHANPSATEQADLAFRREQERTKWSQLTPAERAQHRLAIANAVRKGEITPEAARNLLLQLGPNVGALPQPDAVAQSVAPSDVVIPPDVQRQRDDRRLQLLQQERADEVRKGNLNNVAQLNREIEALTPRGQSAPAVAAPAPRRGPDTSRIVSPEIRDQVAAEAAKEDFKRHQDLLKSQPQDLLALNSSVDSIQRMISSAQRLLDHKGLPGIFGAASWVLNRPGGQAASAEALLKTLRDQIFKSSLDEMKAAGKNGSAGMGALTEAEGKRLENMKAPLDNAQSLEQAKQALRDIIAQGTTTIGNLRAFYDQTYAPIEASVRRTQVIPPEGSAREVYGSSATNRPQFGAKPQQRGRVVVDY